MRVEAPKTPDNVRIHVKYAECVKNHAEQDGGYVVDGCGEFMASGARGTEGELLCDACGCHRDFHKQLMVFEDVF